MNVLLTSAGRRTYMVDYFKEALSGKGLLYAANSQMSPALTRADGYFISPIIYSDEYIPFLLGKCRELKVDLVVSLFDIDVPVLAAHRAEFEAAGVRLAVSGTEMLTLCSDKLKMSLELGASEAGERASGAGASGTALISCPKAYTGVEEAIGAIDDGRLSWPVIVKPRFGMGSIGVLKAYDEVELMGAYSMCRRAVETSYLRFESNAADGEPVVIEELCRGTEYGLDVICDLDGNYVNTIIRKKFAMRSGETDEAVILGPGDAGYSELMELGRALALKFRPIGLTDLDVIMDTDAAGSKDADAKCGSAHDAAGSTGADTGTMAGLKPYVIDINARFGGGYPFSHAAGADVPRAYVLWLEAAALEARTLKAGEAEAEAEAAAELRQQAAECCHAKPGVHGYKDIVPLIY
ncbi:MAG: ATP-grasp domain-containing protein [Eubacteriales bacterium]|nr:ATP-grasp domain-containing protein [Eubacteriales bacterium]